MSPRPVILIFTRHYLPGYRAGGPIRTLASLVERLGDEFDFRIVCKDRDYQDHQPFDGVDLDAWNQVGKARVFYAGWRSRGLAGLRRLLRDTPHDVLYLNSYFHPNFTIGPLLLRALRLAPRTPLVVAPRGEFSDGALALKSPRKRTYMRAARFTRLYAGARWQASTQDEARAIQSRLGVSAAQTHIARNLTAAVPPASANHQPRDRNAPLRVCFLSRITPMKNLDFALQALARTRQPMQLAIYGPIFSEPYWAACRERIASLPTHIEVDYHGPVEPPEVRATIARHDVFFVPSRGENFGHVFMEAWSAGVPVLVSDRTPWRKLQQHGVGRDLPLTDPAAFAAELDRLATQDPEQACKLSRQCLNFARQQSDAPELLEANRRLFLDLLPGTPRPSTQRSQTA